MKLLSRPWLSYPKVYLRPWGLSGGNRTRSQEKRILARDHLITESLWSSSSRQGLVPWNGHGDRLRPTRWTLPPAITMIFHGVHAAAWSGCSCATGTPPRPQPSPWMLPMHPWKRLAKEVFQRIGHGRRWSHRAAAERLPWSTSFDSLMRPSNARHFS